MHKGKPKTKLKEGGYVGVNNIKKRLYKPSRKSSADDMAKPALKAEKYARGGATKGKGKTTVNVIVAGGHGAQPAGGAPMGAMPPRPMPPPGAMPPGAGAPPPPPGAGMPPGMPPRPPQMAKRGGAIKSTKGYPISDGAGGGEGRLEKAAAMKHKSGKKKET